MSPWTVPEYWQLLKKRWWFIMLFTAICAGAMSYLSYVVITPKYSNSSTILVNDRNKDNANSSLSYYDVLLYEKLLGTYKEIIMSKRILKPVIDRHLPGYTVDDLHQRMKVSTNPNSQVLKITVTDTDYKLATDLANWIAQAFQDNLKQIMTIDNVQILDNAEMKPTAIPASPRYKLNLFLALLFGLLGSIALVTAHALLDRRIRLERDLIGLMNFPVLGSIPNYKKRREKALY